MSPASMSGLQGRDRRALVVGAVVIGAIVASARGVPVVIRWRHASEASRREVIEEARRTMVLVRALPALRDSLAARRVRLSGLDSSYVEGDTPAAAGVQLAELVSDAAAAAEVQLGAVQLDQVDSTAVRHRQFNAVALRTSISGDLESVVFFLASLEQGPALIAVREVTITQPEPSLPRNRPETLRADVLVEALASVGARAGATP